MKLKLFSGCMGSFLCILNLCFNAQNLTNDSSTIRSIYDFQLSQGSAYQQLRSLTKDIGGRLSGSKEAEQAVLWAQKKMWEAGADTVYLQPCKVPHWERGQKERAILFNGTKFNPELQVQIGRAHV